MSAAAPPVRVDARGMRCPWPALRLARAMRGAAAAELLSDDPRAAEEAQALAALHGWQLSIVRDGNLLRISACRA
jgi:tRNA 2-thiouridine synthesizing protein A